MSRLKEFEDMMEDFVPEIEGEVRTLREQAALEERQFPEGIPGREQLFAKTKRELAFREKQVSAGKSGRVLNDTTDAGFQMKHQALISHAAFLDRHDPVQNAY
jgi:hypothetical protein